MKAAVLYGNDNIRYDDYSIQETTTGMAKVRIRATGICGSDIPRVFHNGAHFYPIVLGHEFAGDVVEIGEDVFNIAVGDTVSGVPLVPCMRCNDCQKGNYAQCKNYSFIGSREQGSFAEFVVIPAANVVKYDKSIPYEQAAMFEPSTVALHGLFANDYQGGGNVAVLGGGTIGLFTMQWAKIFGAKSVTVFDISDERLDVANKLGADFIVNSLKEEYKENTFDYVFETAGQVKTMQMAFEIATNKAKVCFIGTPHVEITFTPKMWENMNRKEFKLTGSWMGYSSPFPGKEWELTAHYFASKQLKFDDRMIFKRFPLSEAAKAFELFKNPTEVKGKVMLVSE